MPKGELAQQTTPPVVKPCSFCKPIDYPHFQRMGRDRLDLAHLIETENVYLKPDILPSSPVGHYLVIPKPHNVSFAALPYELADEVGSIIYQAEQVMGMPMVFFEHGSIEEGSKIQSVYHQHGHLVPDGSTNILDFMRDWLNKMGIAHTVIDTPDLSPMVNLRQQFRGYNYLYVQQGRMGLMAHDNVDGDPTDGFPSQISQRGVSKLFRNRELNWKLIPTDDELARLSVASIAHIVDDCGFPKPGVLGGVQGIRTVR